ncbi:MAG: hypothetical protein ACKPKO_34710, partial [Candidatus Fonsibacter sp.]
IKSRISRSPLKSLIAINVESADLSGMSYAAFRPEKASINTMTYLLPLMPNMLSWVDTIW